MSSLEKAKTILLLKGFTVKKIYKINNRYWFDWECTISHFNTITATGVNVNSFCSFCPTPLQEKRLAEAKSILETRSDTFLSFDRIKDKISWACGVCKIENRSPARNLAKGSRCGSCFTKAKKGTICRPRLKIEIGQTVGLLEVIENLGVKEGHSYVRVKNISNGIIGDMLSSFFLKGTIKLRSKEEKRAIYASNASKSPSSVKGSRNPKLAIYTWRDVLNKSNEINFEFLNCPLDLNEKIYDCNSGDRWHFKCFCNNIFYPSLGNLMQNGVRSCGCVKSHGQKQINEFIKSLGFDTDWNNRNEISPFELDIYIPSKKIAIEYQGLHWHGELLKKEEAKLHMIEKSKMCKNKGIRLIVVFEDEWLTKEEQVKGYLSSVLGTKSKVIGASKCKIIKNGAKFLCSQHHLQGGANGLEYSLLYKDEIVAAAIFAKPNASRQNFRKSTYELARYCVKPGIAVPGGLERLMKAFSTEYSDIKELISYSDNRWSNGGIYRKTGFVELNKGTPSYHYFKYSSQTQRYHRYKFRKSECVKLLPFSNHMTEWQIMKELGYDRIWDLGATKWIKELKS